MSDTINIILTGIAVCLLLAGGSIYIWDILKGTTRPSIISQSLWAICPLLSVFASLSAGADIITIASTLALGVVSGLIVIVALFLKKGSWKSDIFDYGCGFISLIALILYSFFDLYIYTIILAILADLFAGIPTIRKSWKDPKSETGTLYILSLCSIIIILPTINTFDIANSGFQLYLIFFNITIIISIYRFKLIRWVKNML